LHTTQNENEVQTLEKDRQEDVFLYLQQGDPPQAAHEAIPSLREGVPLKKRKIFLQQMI